MWTHGDWFCVWTGTELQLYNRESQVASKAVRQESELQRCADRWQRSVETTSRLEAKAARQRRLLADYPEVK